jgi:HPt (histidine-containing phosphotransfer) domain-containing protein
MSDAEHDEIVVEVDGDLEEIVPGYLDHRRAELPLLLTALAGGDWETLRRLAHDLKGTGGGYGFDILSDLGRALEQAAKSADTAAAQPLLKQIDDFLRRVRVVYVGAD